MNEKKLNELLIRLKVENKIDVSNREQSILALLEHKLNEFVDRDDEEMQDILYEAITFQKNVIEELEMSVVVSDEVSAEKKSEKEISEKGNKTLRGSNDKPKIPDSFRKTKEDKKIKSVTDVVTSTTKGTQGTTTTTSGKTPPPQSVLWFVSKNGSKETQDLFDALETALADKEFNRAKELADQIWDRELNAGVFLALYMVNRQISDTDMVFKNHISDFKSDKDLLRVRKYANQIQAQYIDKCLKDKQLEEDYNRASIKFMNAADKKQCAEAAALYDSLGDYKDSKNQAERCREKEREFARREAAKQAEEDKRKREEDKKKKQERKKKEEEDKKKEEEDRRQKRKEFIKDFFKKKKNTAGSLGSIEKIIYIIVIMFLLYLGTSFRMVTTELAKIWSFEEREKIKSAVSTIYQPLPLTPLERNPVVGNSIVGYVAAYHQLNDLTIENSNITKYWLLNKELSGLTIRKSLLKELVIEDVVEDKVSSINIENSPKTEKIVLGQECDSFYVENCENLKVLEMKGVCRQDVKITNCPSLETIITSEEVKKIRLEGSISDTLTIQSENDNIEVELDMVESMENLTIKGNNNGSLKYRYSDAQNLMIEDFTEVVLESIKPSLQTVTFGKKVRRANIYDNNETGFSIHINSDLQGLEWMSENLQLERLVYEPGTYQMYTKFGDWEQEVKYISKVVE